MSALCMATSSHSPKSRFTQAGVATCSCGAATRPGLVLDPFMGSGTVALVARQHGRDWLGIELNAYVKLTRERLERQP
jgi:tRNA G10  N-methylase Trm11